MPGAGATALTCLCKSSAAFRAAPVGTVVACKLPKLPPGYRSPYNGNIPNEGYVDPKEGGRARLAHQSRAYAPTDTTSHGNKKGNAYFRIKAGAPLLDGRLKKRGTITGSPNLPLKVRINYGQRMVDSTRMRYIYVFSVTLAGSGATTFSG
jgi:hypothetical protein